MRHLRTGVAAPQLDDALLRLQAVKLNGVRLQARGFLGRRQAGAGREELQGKLQALHADIFGTIDEEVRAFWHQLEVRRTHYLRAPWHTACFPLVLETAVKSAVLSAEFEMLASDSSQAKFVQACQPHASCRTVGCHQSVRKMCVGVCILMLTVRGVWRSADGIKRAAAYAAAAAECASGRAEPRH